MSVRAWEYRFLGIYCDEVPIALSFVEHGGYAMSQTSVYRC